ncbi:MAG: aspartate/glutamate racemase family protein [Bacteroidales bacterium]|nr:aspartate/glutamate racemase family protein [Bacteroidales bacterium]
MKTIGFIGGMSWESSVVYYQLANRRIRELVGGNHSCKSVMYTVDFDEIVKLQHNGEWVKLDRLMADAATRCEKAGAEVIVLCTNTMHLCKDAILKKISVPFLHIAHATGDSISLLGLKKIALLGTRFTMEKDFYKKELEDNYGIDVIVPESSDREKIHNIIFQELVKGDIKDDSRETFKDIISKLRERGAEGVILGCTEIPLLISQEDVDIPVFDTTKIHAYKAVEFALQEMDILHNKKTL